jgi:hypothetical protein
MIALGILMVLVLSSASALVIFLGIGAADLLMSRRWHR